MSDKNWLEKVIEKYKKTNPSVEERKISSVQKLVSSSDVQDKELCQSELTQHVQELLEIFLNKDKEVINEKHES